MYNVTVQQDNLPKGAEVQIPGLGTFENGSTTLVEKEKAEAFRTFNSGPQDILDDKGNPTGQYNWTQGPTLLQASENMYGVTVETASPPKQQVSKPADKNEGGDK